MRLNITSGERKATCGYKLRRIGPEETDREVHHPYKGQMAMCCYGDVLVFTKNRIKSIKLNCPASIISYVI